MARRIITTNTGGSTQYGSVDGLTKINKLLTGEDQSSSDSSFAVDINTQWTFSDSKMQVANPANTSKYTIAGSSIGGNRVATLPNLNSNDEFVTIAHPQTITGKTINVPSGSGGTISSVVGPDIMLYPTSFVRQGAWTGGSLTAGYGFLGGLLTSAGATVTNTIINATDGKYSNTTSATTVGSNAAVRGQDGTGVIRQLNPRFFCKFRVNSGTDTRLFIGLWSTNSAFITGADDWLNAKSGYGLALRTADQPSGNWQIAYNEGSGATNFQDTTVVKNTSTHIFEIRGDEANTKWQYNLDNAGWTDTPNPTTEQPGQTTAVYPYVGIQNLTAGTGRSLDIWQWGMTCTEPSIG